MFTDWQQVGIFPLQDHDEATPIAGRMQLVGGRIRRWAAPETGADPGDGLLEFAEDGAQGTLGDIHPWLFWQTSDQTKRGMGSWSMAWAGQVGGARATGGGPTTGGGGAGIQAEVTPVRYGDWTADLRYVGKTPGWPTGFPRPVMGQIVSVFPATSERSQSELMLNGDPRLICAAHSGPGDSSSIVVDLDPTSEPCMEQSAVPGLGGRSARISTAWRVIPIAPQGPSLFLPITPGNFLAWNLGRTQQEGYAGFGACWGALDTALPGPITGGPPNPPPPITSGGSTNGLSVEDTLVGDGDMPDPQGVEAEERGDAWGRALSVESPSGWGSTDQPQEREPSEDDGSMPSDYGRKFKPRASGTHGVSMMSSVDAGGPLHCGHINDKHRLGTDRDGNPINSGHISTKALYYQNVGRDGPLFFEGPYAESGGMPLVSRVHLTWDKDTTHGWVLGGREGVWRWFCEVPDMPPQPPGEPGQPGQPGQPGEPGQPGGPITPGGGPRPGPPSPPSPPGGGSPPGGPITPGGGPGGGGGGGPPGGPGTTCGRVKGPITPNPGGRRFPRRPATDGAGNPLGPTTPGGGSPQGPQGPITGGGTRPPRSKNDQPDPSTVLAENYSPLMDEPRTTAPEIRPGLAYRDEPLHPATVTTVGGAVNPQQGPWQLYRPFLSGFAGFAFRPQLWTATAPNFLNNPGLVHTVYQREEPYRPTVMTMVAWGAQDAATGDYSYTQRPGFSVARGGAASGGVLYMPPQLRMEDYLGLGDTPTAPTPATQSWLTAAPGVGFALGTPHIGGGLGGASVQIVQASGGNQAITIAQLDSARAAQELLRAELHAASGERQVSMGGTGAVKIPRGTTAQRPTNISPTGGELRVNTSVSPEVLEFYDGAASTWRTASGGGGGGGGGLITNGDYTASAGLRVVGRWTNSAGALQEITLGKGLEFDASSIRVKSLDVSTAQLGDDITVAGKGILTESTKAGMRSYLELNSYNPVGW